MTLNHVFLHVPNSLNLEDSLFWKLNSSLELRHQYSSSLGLSQRQNGHLGALANRPFYHARHKFTPKLVSYTRLTYRN